MLRFARNDVVSFASNAELKQRRHLPHLHRPKKNTAPSTKCSVKARGLEFPEAFTGNEALDFALD